MAHEAEPAHPRPVEQFREYLHLLARLQLGAKFQTQLDPSDLVQQALLRAHEKQHQFRGRSEGERAADMQFAGYRVAGIVFACCSDCPAGTTGAVRQ